MIRKILLTCFTALFALVSWGQAFQFRPDKFVQRLTATDLQNNIYNVASGYQDPIPFTTHDKWSESLTGASGPGGTYTFKSIQDYVRVGILTDPAYAAAGYEYNVTVQVKAYTPASYNAGTPVQFTAVIPVTWHPDSLSAYNDLSVYKFSGYEAIQVTIIDVTDKNNPSTHISRSGLKPNFYIEAGVEVQRYDYNAPLNPTAYIYNGNLIVDWTVPGIHGSQNLKPAQYDLEWTYIDDYKLTNYQQGTSSTGFTSGSTVSYDFRKNSTRVRLSNTYYSIPVVYEHGAIVYRVRSVRPDMNSGYRDLNFGSWSQLDYGTASLSDASKAVLIADPHMHDSLNWQYTINFAEEGKYKHVINYFDGALKDRQTQTKINTDDNYVVAVDKVYDYEGRPSIQTLPVPMQQQNLQYRPDVTINSATNAPYTAADFDKNCIEPLPAAIPALSNTAAANIYYSPLNPDKTGMQQYVPDAQGYPFIQSIYSPDNTNKVLLQGGAGIDHQLSAGHGTKYEYLRPSQTEIDRLLGTEAGEYEFYPKQVVTDPNGQTNYTVMNPAGKVVVTGLLGTPDVTGKPIDILPNIGTASTVCSNMLQNITQQQQGDRVVAENSFYVDNPNSAASLKYSVSIPFFPTGCNGKYLYTPGTYTVRVTNECGMPVLNDAGHLAADSNTVYSPYLSNITTYHDPVWYAGAQKNGTLNKAKYLVKKELSFSMNDISGLTANFIYTNEPSCYHDSNYFIRNAVEAGHFPCADSSATNMCDLRREEMIKELWPGAKYGPYVKDNDSNFSAGVSNSIFTPYYTGAISYSNNANFQAWGTGIDNNGNQESLNATSSHYQVGIPDNNGNIVYSQGQVFIPYPQSTDPRGVTLGSNNNYIGDVYFKTNIFVSAQVAGSIGFIFSGDYDYNSAYPGSIVQYWQNGTSIPLVYNSSGIPVPSAPFSPGNNEIIFKIHNQTGAVSLGLIFTNATPEYRYQSPCIASSQPVTIGGTQYTSFATIPPQVLINNFSDTIAAALLPLHPEYCKLLACNDGPFQEQMEGLQTWQHAQAAGRFALSDIIHADPLYTVTPTTTQYNRLAYVGGSVTSGQRIDVLALTMAYCGTGSPGSQAACASDMYSTQIAAFTFTTDAVKQRYFELLKQLYMGNRNILEQKSFDAAGSTCGPCQDKRMTLTGNPVFPVVYDGNGDMTAAGGIPQWMADLFNQAANGTLGNTMPAPVTSNVNSANADIIQGTVNNIISKLQNCTVTGGAANTTALNNLALDLTSQLQSGVKLTPAILKSRMQIAGLTIDDLCHPFLTAYDIYSIPDDRPAAYLCAPSYVYTDAAAFFNDANVQAAITSATATGGTTTTYNMGATVNNYSGRIYNYYNSLTNTGTQSLTLQAFTRTAQVTVAGQTVSYPYIAVKVLPSGGPTIAPGNILYLYIKGRTEPSGSNIHSQPLNGASSINATGAICINDDIMSMNSGIVTANTFILTATVNNSSAVDSYYVWNNNNDWPLMQPLSDESISNALTCVDLLAAMQQFHTDQSTYLYDEAANHPLYEQTVANYLNYYFDKQYSFNDYYGLMNGCAITDKIEIPRHSATARVHLSTSAISSFISHAGLSSSRELITYNVGNGQAASPTGSSDLYIDLNTLPDDSIAWYKGLIANTASWAGGSAYFMENSRMRILAKRNVTPALTDAIVAASGFASNVHADYVTVNENGTPVDYLQIDCDLISGTPPSQLTAAQSLAGLKSLIQGYNAFAFYDQELLRSSDYSSPYKQYVLDLIYSNIGSSHEQTISNMDPNIMAALLNGTLPFTMPNCTYTDPYCTGIKTDLYAYDVSDSHPGFGRLTDILSQVDPSTGAGAYNRIFPNTTFSYIGGSTSPNGSSSTPLAVARKANGTYWYRYFDASNHLYNIYITPPADIPNLSAYQMSYVQPVQGDDSVYTFSITLSNGPNMITCTGHTDFVIGYAIKFQNIILDKDNSRLNCFDSLDCEHDLLLTAIKSGQQAYDQYFDSLHNDMSKRMMAWMLNGSKDTLTICTSDQKYQYTLYYYDQAGNLTRTVPPAGVHPLSVSLPNVDPYRNNPSPVYNAVALTSHDKVSYYKYNSLNQLVYQQTPDGGITYFFYDAAGRLVFSQNSKQRPGGKYSYTLYDDQGRVVETGQAAMGCTLPDLPNVLFDITPCQFPNPNGSGTVTSVHPPYVDNADMYDMNTLRNYVRSFSRTDVVVTVYDTAITELGAIAGEHLSTQENLRKRVSSILYFQNLSNTSSASNIGIANWASASQNPDFGTYYSYDMLGNVKTISYSYQRFSALKQRYKRVDYDYDLLSGKVNMVSYNRNRPDQFYHKYAYDADNRITQVTTSNDGVIWNTDARYSYYKHGPLASVKIGDGMIQSLEYAYTIQGWLKAINGDVRNPQKEMGQNGLAGDVTYARDAIAHALDYFQNDYKPIGGTLSPVISLPGVSSSQNLWNGNIVRQTTSVTALGSMQRSYRYDQLQRLTQATNGKVDENALTVATPSSLYKSTYAYDPDGNIQTLQRWDGNTSPVQIDNFTYNYTPGNTDNKLQYVADAAGTTSGTDLQPGQTAGNYQYDKIGNLIKDNQGHIKIDWNLYGKVKTITDTTSPNKVLNFDYDGAGNRVFKEYVIKTSATNEDHKGEYYVHDASGNILAVYKTHSIYNPVQVIKVTNTGIKGQLGQAALASFLGTEIAPLPGFGSALQDQALHSMPDWVQQQVSSQTPGYYMLADGNIYNRMLYTGFDYIPDLRNADLANTPPETPPATGGVIASALSGSKALESGSMINMLMTVLQLSGPCQSLLRDFDANIDPHYSSQVWADLGVVWKAGDHEGNVAQMYNLVSNGGPKMAGPVALKMTTYMDQAVQERGDASGVPAFMAAVEADDGIFNDPNLSQPDFGFIPTVRDALFSFGDKNRISSFFDGWAQAPAWLALNSSQAQLLGIQYSAHTDAMTADFINQADDDVLATVIAGVPSMTTGQYARTALLKLNLDPVVLAQQLSAAQDTIKLAEHHIYGSSRLGIQNYDTSVLRNVYDQYTSSNSTFAMSAPAVWYSYAYGDLVNKSYKDPWGNADLTQWQVSRNLGKRYYELTDHLGNVLATVLDRKTGHVNSSIPTLYDYYNPDLASATDYYPGGMPMNGRYVNGDKTPNGYNGKRNTNEVYGTGNFEDYGMRGLDNRLMRFWGVDPLTKKYPELTPYQFASNNPVQNIDIDGLEGYTYTINFDKNGKSHVQLSQVVTALFDLTVHQTVQYKGNYYFYGQEWNFKPYKTFDYVKELNGKTEAELDALFSKRMTNDQIAEEKAAYDKEWNDKMWAAAIAVQYAKNVAQNSQTKNSSTNCFVAGTLVSTPKGLTPIEKIKVGDTVWAYDIQLHKNVKCFVPKTYTNYTSRLIKLVIGNQLPLLVTAEHKFFANGKWKTASTLIQGDRLLSRFGKEEIVSNVQPIDTFVKVYNFEVELHHNYFVLRSGILVHNDCGLLDWDELKHRAIMSDEPLSVSTSTDGKVFRAVVQNIESEYGGNIFKLLSNFNKQATAVGAATLEIKGIEIVNSELNTIFQKANGKSLMGYEVQYNRNGSYGEVTLTKQLPTSK